MVSNQMSRYTILLGCGSNQLIKCLDAKRGRAANDFDKGYKLFAIDEGASVDRWQIGPMNQGEATVAKQLLTNVKAMCGEGYLLGDSLCDSNALYGIAFEEGLQLIFRRQKPGRGLRHHPHHPARLRSIDQLEGGSIFGRPLYACRISIEQSFAQIGNLGCGMCPLLNWVRRPRRV